MGDKKFKVYCKKIIDNRGRTPAFGDFGIPMLEVSQITDGNKTPKLEFDKFVDIKILDKFLRDKVLIGDILISTVGATCGKSVIIEENPNFFIAQNLIGLRFFQNSYNVFIYYFLSSKNFIYSLQIINKSNTIDNLKVSVFINNPIPLPPLSEQKAIADFLDRETAKIDNLIAHQEKLIELLLEKRQALISHAVTKGIPGKKRKMKPSGVEWLGEIPEEWEVKRLKYISSCNDDSLNEKTDSEYELEYIDIGSVSSINGIINKEIMYFKNSPSRARRIVKKGDIIISTVRTYLEAIASIDFEPTNTIVSTGFAVIRPNISFENKFASFVMRCKYFINQVISKSVGVSYPSINSIDMMNLPIPLPPLSEQKAIADFLDRETAKIDSLIEKAKLSIELSKEKRQALISSAVTGKIDVRGV